MNDWLTANQAAQWLGVTLQHMRVLANRRKWRRVRLGRVTAYYIDDVADEAHRRAKRRDQITDV